MPKITELPAATAPTGTEVVPVVQGGVTKRTTLDAAIDPKVAAAAAAEAAARTAAIDNAVAALAGAAPATLDTLAELAAALGDDPNLAATLTTLIGTKAAKAANLADLADPAAARDNLALGAAATKALDVVGGLPVLTDGGDGTPVINPTQLPEVGASSAPTAITANDQSGTTYTLVADDAGKVIRCTNASAVTVTVPPNSSVAFAVGTIINVYAAGAAGVAIAAGSGVTIRNNSVGLAQYEEVSLRKDATDEWVRVG